MSNSQWVTFSFKCHKVQDQVLIDTLNGCSPKGRSAFIRTKIYQSLRLPLPTDPEVLSPSMLDERLEALVEQITERLTGISIQQARQSERRRVDVNDNGRRIPDF